MTLREDMIMEKTSLDSEMQRYSANTYNAKIKNKKTKRYKMRFATRFAIFAGITFIIMTIYVFSFINGSNLGIDLNNFTDTLLLGTINLLSQHFPEAFVSTRYTSIERMITFLPFSVLLFAGLCGVIISSIAAICCRWWMNRTVIDDGTSNFILEENTR